MNNTMTYKGYTARVEFDPRDNIFVGLVLGIEETITFHGGAVAELTTDFHAAVDHYIADCVATGRKPHKPYSGKLMLRIPPESTPMRRQWSRPTARALTNGRRKCWHMGADQGRGRDALH